MTPKTLKQFRRKHHLTQAQLAKHLGYGRVAIARWETGVTAIRGKYIALALADLARRLAARK